MLELARWIRNVAMAAAVVAVMLSAFAQAPLAPGVPVPTEAPADPALTHTVEREPESGSPPSNPHGGTTTFIHQSLSR